MPVVTILIEGEPSPEQLDRILDGARFISQDIELEMYLFKEGERINVS